jgi:two-component system response regulator CpxR
MATIVLFSGIFCREDMVIEELGATTGFRLVGDKEVVGKAAKLSGVAESKISKAFSAKTSVFNKFTMEKETSIAYIKLALADMLTDESVLVRGHTGLLIPKAVSHVLRICLIADMPYRTRSAVIDQGLSEKEAAKRILRGDLDSAAWIRALFDVEDPWDPSLFDMVIPVDKRTPSEAATAIIQNATKSVIQPTPESRQAIDDFSLAAQVEKALLEEGHHVVVSAANGVVTLVINRHVLMLKRLEEELKATTEKVAGVTSVITEVGKDFHKSHIYRKHDFQSPSRVLLVDDEREFAETLSERLMIRDVGTAVAHDGQSALSLIENDDPEVMIIDLKMPDINGLEILKKVKKTRPEIEVIVLTGHGSDVDKDICLNLGALAYLQKPVEIEELNALIQKANAKIRAKKKS